MAFENYNVKDNAFSTLLVGISASATTLEVQAGAGYKFPATKFIATLVQYEILGDETSVVVKREKVLVSNNATDTFTITKGFDGDTPVSFNAGDFIYLNVVSAIIEDLQDETTRIVSTDIAGLETNKLNKVGGLRTGLTAYKLIYINNLGVETELALGTIGQVLISQGATSNPIWQAPSVDIAGLTATTEPIGADTAVINTGAGNRKTTLLNLTKGLQEASETLKGTVERSTNAEVITGTDTTRYVSPSHLRYTTGINLSISNQTITQGGTTRANSVGSQSIKGGIVTVVRNYDSNIGINPNYWGLDFSVDGVTWTNMWNETYTGSTATNPRHVSPSFLLNAGYYYRVFAGGTGASTVALTVTAYLQEAS